MKLKYSECPECGTEIIEPDPCGECNGTGMASEDEHCMNPCLYCDGTGFSNDYHCSHCSWSHEE